MEHPRGRSIYRSGYSAITPCARAPAYDCTAFLMHPPAAHRACWCTQVSPRAPGAPPADWAVGPCLQVPLPQDLLPGQPAIQACRSACSRPAPPAPQTPALLLAVPPPRRPLALRPASRYAPVAPAPRRLLEGLGSLWQCHSYIGQAAGGQRSAGATALAPQAACLRAHCRLPSATGSPAC